MNYNPCVGNDPLYHPGRSQAVVSRYLWNRSAPLRDLAQLRQLRRGSVVVHDVSSECDVALLLVNAVRYDPHRGRRTISFERCVVGIDVDDSRRMQRATLVPLRRPWYMSVAELCRGNYRRVLPRHTQLYGIAQRLKHVARKAPQKRPTRPVRLF